MRQTYGYIRVSTREQNEARQLDALYKAGVEEKRIYMDKQSGKDFDRQGYQQLLHRLRRGDTLFVKSIDRLGRNYNEILEQWRLITKEKQAAIVVLDMPLLDTRQDPGSDGDADLGHCATAFELCGADGARVHPPAAAGGHHGGQGAGRAVRAGGHPGARGFSGGPGALGGG